MNIAVDGIYKAYGDFVALDNISFDIKSGEMIALLGPSGSGKTTLLRIIAGLDLPDQGTILINEENILNQTIRDRQVGFVFQHYALFNHMSVFDNIAFGLRVKPKHLRPSEAEIASKVMAILELMHLENFVDRYPGQLSGGQKQRVALARALAIEPKILLLDEPFGALDAKVRKELRNWMRRLQNEMNITSIFVTHDQEEAMEVADRVLILNRGRAEQLGTPSEVYNKPANAFVYDFLGDFNVFEGWQDEHNITHLAEYETSNEVLANKYQPSSIVRRILSVDIFRPLIPKNYIRSMVRSRIKARQLPKKGRLVKIFARPHEMEVVSKPEAGKEYIKASLTHVNPAGSLVKLELRRNNGSFIYAEITKEAYDKLNHIQPGEIFARPKETVIFE